MKDNNGVFTERLKKEREVNQLTLRKMARLLGYNSPSSYMYIERGEIQPSIEKMNKISHILKKPVNYFFKLNIQETQI
jgi:transcriptional regulator with XRE-family HTH domain